MSPLLITPFSRPPSTDCSMRLAISSESSPRLLSGLSSPDKLDGGCPKTSVSIQTVPVASLMAPPVRPFCGKGKAPVGGSGGLMGPSIGGRPGGRYEMRITRSYFPSSPGFSVPQRTWMPMTTSPGSGPFVFVERIVMKNECWVLGDEHPVGSQGGACAITDHLSRRVKAPGRRRSSSCCSWNRS
jgi:hypothetical protein